MSDKENRDMLSEVSGLAQWEKPELRRLDALAAELAPAPTADGAVAS